MADDKVFVQRLQLMLAAIQDVYPSPKRIMWLSFLRGVFFGLGSTIGAAVVVAILTYMINQLGQIPGVHLQGIQQLLQRR